jgi:phosphate transport system protein
MHLEKDLDRVRKKLLLLGTIVEEATNLAIESLSNLRYDQIQKVKDGEARINSMEVEIEEECMKVLALHQPVAGDLRFVIAVLKVNNDLERMGDLAVNIAERAEFIATREPLPVHLNFGRMSGVVSEMLRRSLDSLVRRDSESARTVMQMDDEVDDLNAEMFAILQKLMKEQPDTVESAVSTLSASRHLERIADLSTNIAEDVVFMQEGEVIRHWDE